MSRRLDELLGELGAPPSPAPRAQSALERARAAARSELARKAPVRRWRREALLLVGLCAGIPLVAAVAVLASGAASPDVILSRVPLFIVLLAALAYGIRGALMPPLPGAERMRAVGTSVGLFSVGMVAFWRWGSEATSALPDWVCTASHVAVAIPALVAAGVFLRGFHAGTKRALLTGLAIGTTGAMVGELACEKGFAHVAVWHLGAWAVVVAVVFLLQLTLPRRTFAP